MNSQGEPSVENKLVPSHQGVRQPLLTVCEDLLYKSDKLELHQLQKAGDIAYEAKDYKAALGVYERMSLLLREELIASPQNERILELLVKVHNRRYNMLIQQEQKQKAIDQLLIRNSYQSILDCIIKRNEEFNKLLSTAPKLVVRPKTSQELAQDAFKKRQEQEQKKQALLKEEEAGKKREAEERKAKAKADKQARKVIRDQAAKQAAALAEESAKKAEEKALAEKLAKEEEQQIATKKAAERKEAKLKIAQEKREARITKKKLAEKLAKEVNLKEEADRKAKEEADRKAKEEADRKAKEEADIKAQKFAEAKAIETLNKSLELQARIEAARQARLAKHQPEANIKEVKNEKQLKEELKSVIVLSEIPASLEPCANMLIDLAEQTNSRYCLSGGSGFELVRYELLEKEQKKPVPTFKDLDTVSSIEFGELHKHTATHGERYMKYFSEDKKISKDSHSLVLRQSIKKTKHIISNLTALPKIQGLCEFPHLLSVRHNANLLSRVGLERDAEERDQPIGAIYIEFFRENGKVSAKIYDPSGQALVDALNPQVVVRILVPKHVAPDQVAAYKQKKLTDDPLQIIRLFYKNAKYMGIIPKEDILVMTHCLKDKEIFSKLTVKELNFWAKKISTEFEGELTKYQNFYINLINMGIIAVLPPNSFFALNARPLYFPLGSMPQTSFFRQVAGPNLPPYKQYQQQQRQQQQQQQPQQPQQQQQQQPQQPLGFGRKKGYPWGVEKADRSSRCQKKF